MRNTLALPMFVLMIFLSAIPKPSFSQGLYNQNLLQNSFPDRDGDVPQLETSLLDVDDQLLVKFRTGATAIVDTLYDTGLVTSEPLFRPASIVLDGTPESRGRGKFQMTGTSTLVTFQADATALVGEPRAFADFDFIGDLNVLDNTGSDVRLRDAFGIINVAPNYVLLGGQTFTTFGDNRELPFSIVNDGTPAGAIFSRQAQLRISKFYDNGFNTAVAIENPTNADFVLPAPADATDPNRNIRLQRYPDLVTRLQWIRPTGDENEMDRFHVAALVRGLGYQDVANTEHFAVGWGVSAAARFKIYCNNNIQLGAVVGEGLGRYLYGFGSSLTTTATAAGPDAANELTPIRHVGAYIGYQHFFGPRLGGNIAYGYAQADTTAAMLGIARRTQNGWVNLVYEVTSRFHVGLEYQYGLLEVTEGTRGDNGRIQMTMTLR